MRRLRFEGLTILAAFALVGCLHDQPNFIYMPDMVYSPALKAQQEGSMRMPVKGTIPRDFSPYAYTDPEVAGRELKNPLRPTQSILARGQAMYNTYCIVCHGPAGEGNGSIVGGVDRFPPPPSLQSDRARAFPEGRFYHIMSAGQNLMPSYASQISSQDRWAIVHYVRALQKSKNPTPADLNAAERGE